jgi:hypothetical protein
MITRIWRGWTTPANAAAYQALLVHDIIPGIAGRKVPGYRGMSVLRRDHPTETEFVTLMWFDSIAAVRGFAGEDYEVAVVPERARAVLTRFDPRSAHYDAIVPPPA